MATVATAVATAVAAATVATVAAAMAVTAATVAAATPSKSSTGGRAGGEQEALQALLDGFKEKYPDISVENNPAPGGAGSALDTVIKNRVLNENPPSSFQIWPGKALYPTPRRTS